jgi:hypothetical protein
MGKKGAGDGGGWAKGAKKRENRENRKNREPEFGRPGRRGKAAPSIGTASWPPAGTARSLGAAQRLRSQSFRYTRALGLIPILNHCG